MRKSVLIHFLFLILIFSILSCSNDNTAEERSQRAANSCGDISIAAVGPWSDPSDALFNDYKNGIKLACKEINNKGGVLGRKLKIVWGDDKGNAKDGMQAAVDLSQNLDVIAVVGSINSSVALATSLIYEKNGILMLFPLATSPIITTQPGMKFVFRSIARDDIFAKKLIKYAANNGFRNRAFVENIVIFNEDDVYGNELSREFDKQIGLYKLNALTKKNYSMNTDAGTFREYLKHIKEIYDIDALFIAGLGAQSMLIVNEARKLGLDVPVFCGQGVSSNDINKYAIDRNSVIYCSSYFPENGEKDSLFNKEFKKAYKQLPGEGAVQGYDAVYVLAEAIKIAKSTVPHRIAKAMRKLSYQGIAGMISFNKNGDLKKPTIVLKKYDGSKKIILTNRWGNQ